MGCIFLLIDKKKLLDELRALTDSLVHSEACFTNNTNDTLQVEWAYVIIHSISFTQCYVGTNDQILEGFPQKWYPHIHTSYDLCAALCSLPCCPETVCSPVL